MFHSSLSARRAGFLLRPQFLSRAWVFPALLFAILLPQYANAQRLPKDVVPEHYTLVLTPRMKTATFSGQEKIEVLVRQPVTSITLNSAQIQFESVAMKVDGKTVTPTVTHNKQKEQTTFQFRLCAGKCKHV